ncbi:glutathione S-transferase [Parasulfitobacter algicola]|uniref:Glutathione S-transferase n=1 Tax=Parasulfitobacter algicola TaxID=2614809 RepID=A0ABX2ITI0_9RHOB|nr:glutathione S-transferase [Sulfitobacter algicola]NSX54127.1 glutathione S-transferase [Sulfitobacter algicola]
MTARILYSFRRCPYAMRARLAVQSAGFVCELREVLLRDKALEFLEASPSGTVPCLVLPDQTIDESLDIMLHVLGQNDPDYWLDMPDTWHDLIAMTDGPFKLALDRYKYATRHDSDPMAEREKASGFLRDLDRMLGDQPFLYGQSPRLADMAIAPFVRQFANTDRSWFGAQPWPHLIGWLDRFVTSAAFGAIMGKYPKWAAGDAPTFFPATMDTTRPSP